MMTTDNRMIFNEIIVYVFVALFGISTALIGWVSVQTVELLKVSTSIQEHNRASDSLAMAMTAQIQDQAKQISQMQLTMAEHGWDKR
jgi:hypothetical protein